MTTKLKTAITSGGLRLVVDPIEVQTACALRGWSLSRLAIEARISRPTASNVASGRSVTPATAFRVLRVLGLAGDLV